MDARKKVYRWRENEEEMERLMKRPELILIKGPRQAGKTTFMKHFQKKIGGTYYTLDNPSTLKIFEEAPEELVNNSIIYIDEIQNSPIAGRILRYLYDTYPNVKLVVSGSGAFDKKIKATSFLVGRMKELLLLPLSFREFVHWRASPLVARLYEDTRRRIINYIKGQGKLPSKIPDIGSINILFEEYLKYGGYPAVVLERENKEAKLKDIAFQTIERDILNYFDLREKKKLMDFLQLLSYHNGKIIRLSHLNVDFKTAQEYLSILEESYIISLLYPYFNNPKKELKKSRKLLFYDAGIKNVFSPMERGFSLEQFVFRQLLPTKYWRTKGGAEVDFILSPKEIKEIIPLEVKSTPALSTSLYEFIKTYEPKRAVVFSPSLDIKLAKKAHTEIAYLPIMFL